MPNVFRDTSLERTLDSVTTQIICPRIESIIQQHLRFLDPQSGDLLKFATIHNVLISATF